MKFLRNEKWFTVILGKKTFSLYNVTPSIDKIGRNFYLGRILWCYTTCHLVYQSRINYMHLQHNCGKSSLFLTHIHLTFDTLTVCTKDCLLNEESSNKFKKYLENEFILRKTRFSDVQKDPKLWQIWLGTFSKIIFIQTKLFNISKIQS